MLLRGATVRRGLGGRWRHQSCEEVPTPGPEQFGELADVLMVSQPWPRLVSLYDRLREVVAQLAEIRAAREISPIPEQPTGRHQAPTPSREHEEHLEAERARLKAAIDEERDWKARRLAIDWAKGH